MDFEKLLAPVVGEPDIDHALDSWGWVVPHGVKPLLATAFGDLFVVESSGGVSLLDVIGGTFEHVADSVSAWEQSLGDPDFLDRHFIPAFVTQLRESGQILAQGECYVPKLEPVLGGAWEIDNWSPGRWVWHLERQGRVHFAIKDLPDGTKITAWNYTEI
jgi:hypothetical protein